MSPLRRSHHYHNAHRRKLPPWVIILICVGAALAVSLLVGNLLKLFLDEETYDRLTNPPAENTPAEPLRAAVPDRNAYPFVLGEAASSASPHASVTLNTPDGTLLYTSPVATHLGIAQTDGIELISSMEALSQASEAICGVYHPQAFLQETETLFDAVSLEELALLREFERNGGDEILLSGMELTLDSLPSVLSYLDLVRDGLDNPVGISVPLSVIQSNDGWLILLRLFDACDFIAVDLRAAAVDDPAALLTFLTFHREQYDTRILVSASQDSLVDALSALSIRDFQVVGG
ncbi:MAG: hypothetical protein IJW16_04070 [Clostridia bacterium]|nr:hypothetical protein [Clostridia bacterium]